MGPPDFIRGEAFGLLFFEDAGAKATALAIGETVFLEFLATALAEGTRNLFRDPLITVDFFMCDEFLWLFGDGGV